MKKEITGRSNFQKGQVWYCDGYSWWCSCLLVIPFSAAYIRFSEVGRASGWGGREEEYEFWVTGGRKEEGMCRHKEVYMVSDMMPGPCATRTGALSRGSEKWVNAHFPCITLSEDFYSPKQLHPLVFLISLSYLFCLVVVKTRLLLNKSEWNGQWVSNGIISKFFRIN